MGIIAHLIPEEGEVKKSTFVLSFYFQLDIIIRTQLLAELHHSAPCNIPDRNIL